MASSARLKFHLIKEMVEEICLPDEGLAPLGNLLMAGRQTAVALHDLIFSKVIIDSATKRENRQCCIYLPWGDDNYHIKPVYLQKLALRWARYLDVDFFRQEFCGTEIDGFVKALRENQNIEKLDLSTLGIKLIEILPTCPNLTSLDFDGSQYPSIVSYLTKHPERCPKLEKIKLKLLRKVDLISMCTSNYRISSIKSLIITTPLKCCKSFDFSVLVALSERFPNLADVSLSVETLCEHDEVNWAAYEQLYESFKNFNPPFAFQFDYMSENLYCDFNKELKALASSNGTIDIYADEEKHWRSYIVTSSYPNKVMTLRIQYEYISESEFDSSDDNPMEVNFADDNPMADNDMQ